MGHYPTMDHLRIHGVNTPFCQFVQRVKVSSSLIKHMNINQQAPSTLGEWLVAVGQAWRDGWIEKFAPKPVLVGAAVVRTQPGFPNASAKGKSA